MQEATAQLPVAKVTSQGEGRIGTLRIMQEKKAPAPTTPEAAAAQKADLEMKKATEDAENIAKAKKRAEDAGKLLKEYHIEPRVVLRLLTDGGAVAGALEGQAQAEIEILKARDDLNPEQKQKLVGAIQERYKKLIQYSESREESTREQIKKLEISTRPEDKVLLLDIKSARAQIEQSAYREKVTLDLQLLLLIV